jgi:predicted TIM-barrel fold metal-dependent hydrolase
LDFAKLEIKHQVRPKILMANATRALQLDQARS